MFDLLLAAICIVSAAFFGLYGHGFDAGATFGSTAVCALWCIDDFLSSRRPA